MVNKQYKYNQDKGGKTTIFEVQDSTNTAVVMCVCDNVQKANFIINLLDNGRTEDREALREFRAAVRFALYHMDSDEEALLFIKGWAEGVVHKEFPAWSEFLLTFEMKGGG